MSTAAILKTPCTRKHRGSVLIEAALLLPILLLLTFGMVELGDYFFIQHNLKGAARSGARVAIVEGATGADVEAAVDQTMAAAGVAKAKYQLDLPLTPENANTGDHISVTVRSKWRDVGIRPLLLLGPAQPPQNPDQDFWVKGAAVMRKE
jgi:Flp pilus assembly protein TadG